MEQVLSTNYPIEGVAAMHKESKAFALILVSLGLILTPFAMKFDGHHVSCVIAFATWLFNVFALIVFRKPLTEWLSNEVILTGYAFGLVWMFCAAILFCMVTQIWDATAFMSSGFMTLTGVGLAMKGAAGILARGNVPSPG